LNKALLAEKQKLEIDCKQLDAHWKKFATDCTELEKEKESLGNDCKKLKTKNDTVITQNEQLLRNLEDGRCDFVLLLHTLTGYATAMKNQKLVQSDLDLRLEDLGREKVNVQQLQEQLQGHINLHKQLVEMMQKLPEEVTGNLIGEDSFLGQILSSAHATKAKLALSSSLLHHHANF
jgi:chromosome segregation ATPase